jgi:N-acetylglucosaminyldiphosphoundecaprenol N-acetyl-beta-D-mannosaminyltransferase
MDVAGRARERVINRGKHNVLGVLVHAVDYQFAVDRIIDAAQGGLPFAATALAVHGVMTGALDAEQRYRLNELDLVVPDGQPVRWALNILHSARLRDRVYGPSLMLALCERCARDRLPIYLYGSSLAVLSHLERRLRASFPELLIAGAQPSKFRRISPDEKKQVVDAIRGSGARLVLVGLGCPRQEVWAFEFRNALRIPIVAVGAAFDFHAGTLAQAPPGLQRFGLEWLYRLAHEPRRLWRRYVLLNPLYVAMVAAQGTRLLRITDRSASPPSREMNFG